MKVLATILFVIGVANYAQGLDCLVCNVASTDYNGYPAEICLHPVTTGSPTTGTATCTGAATGTVEYCRSKFVIKDGVVTEADRGCALSGNDHDANTAAVPGDRCTTVFASGEDKGETTCYFSCSTDSCNTVSAAQVQKCSSDCNSGQTPIQGTCNYITGTCVCANGWTGADCSTADTTTTTASRQCVQCNSETDSACASSSTSIDCAGSEAYCSTAYTTIYDASDAVVKTVIVRGCSATRQVVDQCFFSDIFTDSPISDPTQGYNEVTCMSTCDSNGCNTNTANGIVDGTESKRLYCVQCTQASTDDYAHGCAVETTRSLCASGSTYCKSTVTYLMSDKTDLFHTSDLPAFKLRSVVRECATAAVTAACTETTLGTVTGVKKYECTETCQEDGCNVGWPNRPKCITCTSPESPTVPTTEFDGCIDNPPEAAACTFPYEQYCVIMDRGIETNKRERITGYPRRIKRGCSHVDIGTSCTSSTLRSTGLDNCNRTCTTDGCNVGSGSSVPIISLMALFIPTVLGWLTQAHL